MAELTDAELWRAVDATVRDVLLPAIGEEQAWAQAVAVQLVGLARYAAARPAARDGERIAELTAALDALAGNELVDAAWDGDRSPAGVVDAVGRVLAAAVIGSGDAAAQVRAVLRPVVVGQLDDELALTSPLVAAFRGKLDG